MLPISKHSTAYIGLFSIYNDKKICVAIPILITRKN